MTTEADMNRELTCESIRTLPDDEGPIDGSEEQKPGPFGFSQKTIDWRRIRRSTFLSYCLKH